MDARMRPHRLLLYVAGIVAIAALASACGGGSGGTATAADPPQLLTYRGNGLTFRHPAAWKAYPGHSPTVAIHFHPIVYLSTQPVRDPCSTHGNTTSCGLPMRRLRPGGVLIAWQDYGIPVSGLRTAPGTTTRIGGRYAKRTTTEPGDCRKIGADRTIQVVVGSPAKFAVPTYFTACLHGPNLAQNERRVDALLASTRFGSQ
jgi:hypothetical protein